jgi:hypothetical protein
MPLGHHGSEGSHLELKQAVILCKPRSRTCGLLHLILRGVLLPSSYVALLASLIMLTKSMLALTADRVKIDLELL